MLKAKIKHNAKTTSELAIEETPSPSALTKATDSAPHLEEGVEVDLNSLEANIGYGSLIRELQHAYLERVAFNRSAMGGSMSADEARAQAYHACQDQEESQRLYDQMMSYPLDLISFVNLLEMFPVDPARAEMFWEMMKREAGDAFLSGHLASEAIAPVHYMRTAWNVASYLGIRESLVADWQPSGAMELMLIDTLAQSFLQFQYWVKQSVLRTQTRAREEHPNYTRWKRDEKESGWLNGYWDMPYVDEQAAVEFAAQQADRWNRIYMRTLRNLRDLRRYQIPVTINNPQQVNIAAQGGQQMNLTKSES